ncbi:MAG: hypothetical protein Q7J28_17380 [Caulobacter sp.]|nr:hypothetical protein [Caulobacter sp.]
MKRLAGLMAATLLAAGAAPALAQEAPERELRMLGRCALATSVYRSLMPPAPTPVGVTDEDRALYERMKQADPLLRARADTVAAAFDPAVGQAIGEELRAQYRAQMAPPDGPRKTPREALDLYAPILEACIVRADMLPKD